MAVIYGQPVKGSGYLSVRFFWFIFCRNGIWAGFLLDGKIIVLFLVSFEMGLLVFEKDKKLSLILALYFPVLL